MTNICNVTKTIFYHALMKSLHVISSDIKSSIFSRLIYTF